MKKKTSKKSKNKKKNKNSKNKDKDNSRSLPTIDETKTIKCNSEYNLVDNEENPCLTTVGNPVESATVYNRLGDSAGQNYWQPQQSTSSSNTSAQTESHYVELSAFTDRNQQAATTDIYCNENDQYQTFDANTAPNNSLRVVGNQPGSSSTCSSASPAHLAAATNASGGTPPASSEYNQLR